MKMYLNIIFIFIFLYKNTLSINWNGNNWAFGCDFTDNDLSNVRVRGEDCGGKCAQTSGCTHFTWTNYEGGTCWMKKGSVSKSDAKPADPSFVCGILSGSSSSGGTSNNNAPSQSSSTIQMTTINKCPFTVWAGMLGESKLVPGWKPPFNGGWQLNPSQSVSFDVPKDLKASRIWGRTNCKTVNGVFKCETGDCGPNIQCSFDGVKRSGEPPATLAEFTLSGAGGIDIYDVSLVDGFNVKMSIIPKNPSSGSPPAYWCKNPTCTSDINSICPSVLKKFNSAGQVVACYHPCIKFNQDQYCCRGLFNMPNTCNPGKWPVNYASFFKKACPTSYSYAYDDPTSTFSCKNTGYDIVFC